MKQNCQIEMSHVLQMTLRETLEEKKEITENHTLTNKDDGEKMKQQINDK